LSAITRADAPDQFFILYFFTDHHADHDLFAFLTFQNAWDGPRESACKSVCLHQVWGKPDVSVAPDTVNAIDTNMHDHEDF
jgi:hypothetical protein